MHYFINRTNLPPRLADDWNAPAWQAAETLEVANYHEKSGSHRPATRCRLLYDDAGIYGRFLVEKDRYLISRRQKFQDMVCNDSCVEFFVQPAGGTEYFNLEMNCSGVFLLYKIIDPTRAPGNGPLKKLYTLTPEDAAEVRVTGTVPGPFEEELPGPLDWQAGFFLPFALFRRLIESSRTPEPGAVWRANFYKCAGDSSQPHWGSWNPVEPLNFHLPNCFGEIEFR